MTNPKRASIEYVRANLDALLASGAEFKQYNNNEEYQCSYTEDEDFTKEEIEKELRGDLNDYFAENRYKMVVGGVEVVIYSDISYVTGWEDFSVDHNAKNKEEASYILTMLNNEGFSVEPASVDLIMEYGDCSEDVAKIVLSS